MLGKKLKELRRAKRLTQAQLGDVLGISASAVGMYEQGRRTPDAETLQKITAYFNVSSDYMYGKEGLDVGVFLEDFKARLYTDGALMFNGVPLSDDEAHKVLSAMEIGARIALEKNDGKKH
ncbi:MAG: helix-turn-helix transcriptional regulator [Clostridia bacterium]|nr:helix-turn-helix transcriptional regulator [Clostridia bacterium]